MKGLRVLNTRPLNQGDALNNDIRAAGGVPLHFPALEIESTAIDWLSGMPNLTQVKQAIFTSANAVDYYFAALTTTGIQWPRNICVMAIGNATAAALSKHGIHVHHSPLIADSEHLLKLDVLQSIEKQTILLVKGLGGRQLIAETLLSRGAHLIPLAVYRRKLPVVKQEYINSIWQDDAVDIILFTSQQAMLNLFTLFEQGGHSWLCNKPCLVISKRLAKEAYLLGIRTIITCQYNEISGTLVHFNQGLTHDNPE